MLDYSAIGVSLTGDTDILGLWTGTCTCDEREGGSEHEVATLWMSVLTDVMPVRAR